MENQNLEADFLFVISPFMNQVTKRKVKAVQADDKMRLKYGHRPLIVFNSEEAANDFLIDRAKKLVAEKELALKSARTMLEKLRKKLGAETNGSRKR